MNAGQLVRNTLRAFRQDDVESSRRQYLFSVMNNVINTILGYRANWPFLYKTTTLLSEADDPLYALPVDCQRLLSVTYDGGSPLEIFRPENIARYDGLTSISAASMFELTTSPYANVGYVFPTYGDPQILGQGTNWDSTLVSRFFRTREDGELYKIKSYDALTQITLRQNYGGDTQAGLVQIAGATADEQKIVYGIPGVTHFKSWMAGRLIRIAAANYQISSVDEELQRLVLASAGPVGQDQPYSVQSYYEIDPPGTKVLTIYTTPDEDDKDIVIRYYAFQPEITSDFTIPVIPSNFHQLIQYGMIVEYGATEATEIVNLNRYERLYREGIAVFLNNSDPLGTSVDDVEEYDKFRELPT